MTMRSGRMKSSTAAPSFRNSGLETTAKACAAPRAASVFAISARTLSAVPTGTVDLSTTTRGPSMWRGDAAGGREHVLQVGGAVLAGGRAHRDHLHAAVARALRRVGGEGESPGRHVGAHDLAQPRLEDRDLAAVQHRDLALVDVEAEHVVADVGEAGAGDETDVAGADDADFHEGTFPPPRERTIDCRVADGSADRVTGRPITR